MRLPVDNHVITSDYGPRVLNGRKQFHDGIDFISRDSNKVRAILPGVVIHDMDGYIHDKRFEDDEHSAGNYIIIQHIFPDGETYFCRYLHLGENKVDLKSHVVEGEVIGYYGDYGYSFGAHLHFDMYNKNWKKIDPTRILIEEGLI